ncbi:MAG TPA: FadR/GntR family transcriptional regulator [Bryobacteraceae bacterium]|nr:FadR/GntR family transcriptional regulator [Bryobacteraceae bacterium]
MQSFPPDIRDGFREVCRTTLSASVFEKLLSLILSGHWKEGDRILPERELSHELGVGRASLREALKALELIGMIESRVGDGTFVCQRSTFLSRPLLWAITGSGMTRVDELVESRLVLECEIAAFAAARATSDDMKAIEMDVQRLGSGLADPDVLLDADLKFHLGIANAAHNQILLNAVQMIRSLMQQWMLVTLHVPGVGPRVFAQHDAILQAIRAKDPAAAREAMRGHLEEMGGLLIRIKSASAS